MVADVPMRMLTFSLACFMIFQKVVPQAKTKSGIILPETAQSKINEVSDALSCLSYWFRDSSLLSGPAHGSRMVHF